MAMFTFDRVGDCPNRPLIRMEGYSPKDGRAHGSLDVLLYVCEDCHPTVRTQMDGVGMTPYSFPPRDDLQNQPCGYRFTMQPNTFSAEYEGRPLPEATPEESDAATADAVMPRDPVELEERMTAEEIEAEAEFAEDTTGSADEAPGPQDVGELGVSYELTINGQREKHETFREARAVVADLVTRRLGAEPDRVAGEAQALNALFQADGAVAEALETRGEWYTVFDAYGEEPLRIRVTKEA